MKASIHRPTRAYVDVEAIAYNVQQIQAHIPKETLTFAVVKANAYGHGVEPVVERLLPLVDAFCVSNLDEALEARQVAGEKPILILGVAPVEHVAIAIKEEIRYTVASLEWLKALLAEKSDLTGWTVHIKVDSGMGRIGFRSAEDLQEAMILLRNHGAEVEGIFTHFATADEKDDRHFQGQLQRFKSLLELLPYTPKIVHASNSATTLWHADTIFNAVRLGDVMYGLNPSGRELELPYSIRPALSLETELVHIKPLEVGQTVGYGATYQTSEEEWIGTIPIGYADGWTRDMQGFHVLVDGQFCPIVGRVSMDQITIRLPKAYLIGTRVVLIGRDGDLAITTTDVAVYRGTINYEVVCVLSDRVPRVYRPTKEDSGK